MQQKKAAVKTDKPAIQDNISVSWQRLIFLMSAVVIVTFFSLSPVMKNSFINQDDNLYIFDNKDLGKPVPEAVAYFFGPHYFSGNYVPLTMMVYDAVYHVAGTEPGAYHTVSMFIHIVNVLLVFWFIYLLSRKKPWVGAIVALFFGIHPMHLESVAWASELKDMLYASFFVGGLVAYYYYTEPCITTVEKRKNSLRFLIITFVLFMLALLSKPAAIIFPLVLLLIDFYNGRRSDKWLWLEKVPFLILSLIFGIIAIKAQQADQLINNNYPFAQRTLFACYGLLDYMLKFILPANLSAFYPFPVPGNGSLPLVYYAAPVIVIGIAYGVYRTLKYSRLIAFGFLFFFINLLLVLQLLSVGNAIIADRYTYVPYIGLLFIIAMGVDSLYNSSRPALSKWKYPLAAALMACAMLCSYLTYARCSIWENGETISADVLDKYPDDPIALNNKGYILFRQQKYEEAAVLFAKALRSKPGDVKTNINMVNCLLALKKTDDALTIANTALTYAPKNSYLLNIKGNVLSVQQKYPAAAAAYSEAIKQSTGDVNTYINLAACYDALQDKEHAMATLDAGLKYYADNCFLLNNKGYALYLRGRYAEALEYYKAALKSNPDFTTASVNIADCNRAISDSSATHH